MNLRHAADQLAQLVGPYFAERVEVLAILIALLVWVWLNQDQQRRDAAAVRRRLAKIEEALNAGFAEPEDRLRRRVQAIVQDWQDNFREYVRSQYKADWWIAHAQGRVAEVALERTQQLHEALDAAILQARNNWSSGQGAKAVEASNAEIERIKTALRGALPPIESEDDEREGGDR